MSAAAGDVERQAPHDGEATGAVALAVAGPVLVHGHVGTQCGRPMRSVGVLDGPVRARRPAEALGRQLSAEDVVAGVTPAAGLRPPFGGHLAGGEAAPGVPPRAGAQAPRGDGAVDLRAGGVVGTGGGGAVLAALRGTGGMRWSVAGASPVLQVRCAHLSGWFGDYWNDRLASAA